MLPARAGRLASCPRSRGLRVILANRNPLPSLVQARDDRGAEGRLDASAARGHRVYRPPQGSHADYGDPNRLPDLRHPDRHRGYRVSFVDPIVYADSGRKPRRALGRLKRLCFSVYRPYPYSGPPSSRTRGSPRALYRRRLRRLAFRRASRALQDLLPRREYRRSRRLPDYLDSHIRLGLDRPARGRESIRRTGSAPPGRALVRRVEPPERAGDRNRETPSRGKDERRDRRYALYLHENRGNPHFEYLPKNRRHESRSTRAGAPLRRSGLTPIRGKRPKLRVFPNCGRPRLGRTV